MRKYLLPNEGNFYKANLHCHTTLSDGKKTPEEIKQMYMDHGYSIVAYTDHDVFLHNDHLNEENFLALHGTEIQITEEPVDKPASQCKTCHLCFVALEPQNTKHPWKYKSRFYANVTDRQTGDTVFGENEYSHPRIYSNDEINKIIKSARDNGFFVTYNHPTWSLQDSSDFMNYDNLCAMEITNYGCIAVGFLDYNPRVYDEMLRGGKKLYCVATDDNHNRVEDSFGGFTVIKSEKLEYRHITKALEDGNFYASQGPLISSLWYEDGFVYVECEGAKEIHYSCARTQSFVERSVDGVPVTCAKFPIDHFDRYFRITVIDFKNRFANTNAYFVDELLEN